MTQQGLQMNRIKTGLNNFCNVQIIKERNSINKTIAKCYKTSNMSIKQNASESEYEVNTFLFVVKIPDFENVHRGDNQVSFLHTTISPVQ